MEFGEIAKALVDSSFPEGYDVISERKWIEDIERVNEVVTRIVLEPLQCAEELFYHGDRENTREEFPFGDGCRSDPSSCKIDKYKFPVGIDVNTEEDDLEKKYVALYKRVRCDAGYEIRTKEECVRAGIAVGGRLRDGVGDAVVGT